MSPQAHGKPTRAHRRIGLKAMCPHKCREDKTITLIVAKSPQIDLVVLWQTTNMPRWICVLRKLNAMPTDLNVFW
jgi:hypothetical protein